MPFKLKCFDQIRHLLGPIFGFSPRWWRYACTGLKLERLSFHICTYFTDEIFVFLNREAHDVPIYGKTKLQTTTFIWKTQTHRQPEFFPDPKKLCDFTWCLMQQHLLNRPLWSFLDLLDQLLVDLLHHLGNFAIHHHIHDNLQLFYVLDVSFH